MILTYEIHDLQPYINWAYYYHAWQLRDAAQQQKSRAEAEDILSQLDGRYHVYALFDLFPAHSNGDDIVIPLTSHLSPLTLPMLRQQHGDCLCLADFIPPHSPLTTQRLRVGATAGIHSPFILLLQHDPTAWREKILPECNAQLTLSGHTHGGQVSLFGWSPAALSYQDYEGMVYEGSRAMYVSTGLGALIPFRLALPGEIVVITLHSK